MLQDASDEVMIADDDEGYIKYGSISFLKIYGVLPIGLVTVMFLSIQLRISFVTTSTRRSRKNKRNWKNSKKKKRLFKLKLMYFLI